MPRLFAGLRNRTGLVLLALSFLLALAMLTLPPLAARSTQAGLVIAIGVLAYALTTAIVVWPIAQPPAPRGSSMARLLDIRRQMADRLAELQSEPNRGQAALVPVVGEALRHVDGELVPTLRSIVVRHEQLDRQLDGFRSGRVAAPDPEGLDRLERIYSRQQEAIDACVRQAANAYATLIALLQEADEARVIEDAQLWAADLNDIYAGLADVLSGVDPYEQAILRARIEPSGQTYVAQEVSPPQLTEPPVVNDAAVQSELPTARRYPDGLTLREAEVLALLAQGKTSKEIADQLVVTVATVSRHIANIYTKIDARGRADATRYAIRNGLATDSLGLRADGDDAAATASRGAEPIVTRIFPTGGPVGTAVTITGAGFVRVMEISFSGTPAAVATVDSPTRITAIVPDLASTGPVAVVTHAGTAVSEGAFVVTRRNEPSTARDRGDSRPTSDGRAGRS